jgi:transcription elongation factor Elf1
MTRILHQNKWCFVGPAKPGDDRPGGEIRVSVRGNEHTVNGHNLPPRTAVCPKCGSQRTAVTVDIIDDSGTLTLYSCGTCEHRFSRSVR